MAGTSSPAMTPVVMLGRSTRVSAACPCRPPREGRSHRSARRAPPRLRPSAPSASFAVALFEPRVTTPPRPAAIAVVMARGSNGITPNTSPASKTPPAPWQTARPPRTCGSFQACIELFDALLKPRDFFARVGAMRRDLVHRRIIAPAPPRPNSPAGQRVDVLHALRQRRLAPGRAAVLGAEHFAIARGDIHLLRVAVMQTDRHQRAVRLHLVEALPGLADVLAAIERAVLRRGGDTQAGV